MAQIKTENKFGANKKRLTLVPKTPAWQSDYITSRVHYFSFGSTAQFTPWPPP
jgi:hypothetical protein